MALPPDVDYLEEQRVAIRTALDAGHVVVAPERGVEHAGRRRLGWWRIDPTTGAAIDERDDGRGAAGEQIPIRVAVATALLRAGPLITLGADEVRQRASDPRYAMELYRRFLVLYAFLNRPRGG